MQQIQNFDFKILDFIENHMHSLLLDNTMPIITGVGNKGILWIIIGILLIAIKKYRKYGYMLIFALILCGIIGNLTLKPLIARSRPFDVEPLLQPLLISPPKDFSFPSGHTMASFASSIVIYYMNKKLGILAFALSILIAFSRLYLYVHYPSDVLGGMIIGILMGYISIIFYKFVSRQMKKL